MLLVQTNTEYKSLCVSLSSADSHYIPSASRQRLILYISSDINTRHETECLCLSNCLWVCIHNNNIQLHVPAVTDDFNNAGNLRPYMLTDSEGRRLHLYIICDIIVQCFLNTYPRLYVCVLVFVCK